MTEIKIGDIFQDDEYYSERAQWCNENRCYIEEIESKEDGTRRFQIKEIPAPTDEELATQIRAKRNSLLSQTDYLMMPDYPISDEYREKIKTYRQELRDITEQENFPRDVIFPTLPEENLNA